MLDEFAQGHVPSDFEYLQGWRLHGLTLWPVQESVLPQLPSFQEKCFLLHLNEISSISVPVISICPVTRHPWGHLGHCKMAPSSLLHLIKYLYTWARFSWTFFSQGWTYLSVSTHMSGAPTPHPSLWPFTGLTPACPCLCSAEEPSTDTALLEVPTRAGWRWRTTSLDLLALLED